MTKDIIKPAIVLLLICVVAAGALGYVNQITLAPIAEQDAKATETSMKEVLSDAASFGDTVEVSEGNITAVTPALDENGETTGYAVSITTKGFSAGLKLMFGVSTDGVIKGLSVVDNSNETPGLGANSSKPEFTSQFVDQSGTIAVTKDGGSIESLTGATITSRAIANAATEACEYVTSGKAEQGGSAADASSDADQADQATETVTEIAEGGTN